MADPFCSNLKSLPHAFGACDFTGMAGEAQARLLRRAVQLFKPSRGPPLFIAANSYAHHTGFAEIFGQLENLHSSFWAKLAYRVENPADLDLAEISHFLADCLKNRLNSLFFPQNDPCRQRDLSVLNVLRVQLFKQPARGQGIGFGRAELARHPDVRL
ncbi:MAG TPA: hypothetical protein VLI55_16410 [Bryobacteraceae bacterium]|nr:hypothetical protein [Bryobacteraceae bacterium]